MNPQFPHIVNYYRHTEMRNDNTMHVIGVISSPTRWQSRLRLFRPWLEQMLKTKNVKVHIVEGLYGDHKPECAPQPGEDYSYMSVQMHSELWLKEAMINIAVENLLPRDWKYMSWVDCDVEFRDPHWAIKAIHALQKYEIIQPWSQAVALNYEGGICHEGVKGLDSSFGYLHATGKKKSWGHHQANLGYSYAHTGYAWSCSRKFYNNVKGLIDFCLIGSGDHHMAWACIGMAKETVHGSMTDGYKREVQRWQQRALIAAHGRVGYIHGRIEHTFHGPSRQRKYGDRWSILVNHKYDPETDIAYDAQGVIYFVGPHKHSVETALIEYNADRKEDSIEQY